MDKLRRPVGYTIGAGLLLSPYIVRVIQWLGDLDTACAVVGATAEACGSAAVTAFILNPPAWMITLSVAAALVWFWRLERQRERGYIEKLDKLHRDFWEFSAAQNARADAQERKLDEALEEFKSAMPATLRKFDASVGRISNSINLRFEMAAREAQEKYDLIQAEIDSDRQAEEERMRDFLQHTPAKTLREWIDKDG